MDLKIKKVFLIIVAALLLLPSIQMILGVVPKTGLHGVAIPATYPRISKKGFISEGYQKRMTDYLMKGSTLWPWMVKINNQLFYSIFNQISAHQNGSIICANDGTFFQPMYLTAFNREKPFNEAKLGGIPADVKKLQDIFKAKGVPLVVLISPNRIALEPHLVPESRIDPTRLTRINSYDVLPERFKTLGVNYVDMYDYFLKQSNPGFIDINGENAKLPVFLPTASHWNEVGSCLAVNEVFKKINSVKGINSQHIACEDYEMINPPNDADLDLLEIGNLLFPERTIIPGPVVRKPISIENNSKKPKILLIGTSFLFAIQKQLEKAELVEEAPLLFYYRQKRNNSSQRFHNIRKNKKNFWEEYLLSFDAIILETNQASIGKVGHGFVKEALNYYQLNKLPK